MQLTRNELDNCFGDSRRRLPGLSFVVSGCSVAFHDYCIKATGDVPGLIGRYPVRDKEGEPYIGDFESSPYDFYLWRSEDNQSYLHEFGPFTKTGQFTATINIDVDLQVLNRAIAYYASQYYGYYECLDYHLSIVENLGWTYIPLIEEYPYAIFLADESTVAAVAERLRADSTPHWLSLKSL